MEEPENGIHPERLTAMVELLQGIAVDPTEAPGRDNPLRQVVVNTHSPGFVQLQHREDLLFAKTVKLRVDMKVDEGEHVSLSTQLVRLRSLQATWRDRRDQNGVGMGDIIGYLSAPPGAQLSLSSLEGHED